MSTASSLTIPSKTSSNVVRPPFPPLPPPPSPLHPHLPTLLSFHSHCHTAKTGGERKKKRRAAADAHDDWIKTWLEANNYDYDSMNELARDDAIATLGIEVGSWGDSRSSPSSSTTSPPSSTTSSSSAASSAATSAPSGCYIALSTLSFSFDRPQPFDWRVCQSLEKAAASKLDSLALFCKLFDLTFRTPSWIQVGYEW